MVPDVIADVFFVDQYLVHGAPRPRSCAVAEYTLCIQPIGNLTFTSAFLDEQTIDVLHYFDFARWARHQDHSVCLDAFVFAYLQLIFG
ncbi:hypothetical protein D3C76_1448830 [compost metagenome]